MATILFRRFSDGVGSAHLGRWIGSGRRVAGWGGGGEFWRSIVFGLTRKEQIHDSRIEQQQNARCTYLEQLLKSNRLGAPINSWRNQTVGEIRQLEKSNRQLEKSNRLGVLINSWRNQIHQCADPYQHTVCLLTSCPLTLDPT